MLLFNNAQTKTLCKRKKKQKIYNDLRNKYKFMLNLLNITLQLVTLSCVAEEDRHVYNKIRLIDPVNH